MNTTAEYILGIDGGGTSCRARLCAADGTPLGEGKSGSANVRLGAEQVYRSILDAATQAIAQAGLTHAILPRTYAGMGLAGAVSDELCQQITGFSHPFAGVSLVTDAHTACLGAHAGREGAIMILGTGSCGVVFCDGQFHVLGGWGFPVSDQGSGAWIGLRAISYALRAHEGVLQETDLTRQLMASHDNQQSNVTAWMDQAKPKDYGALVPAVIAAEQAGDPVAVQVIQETAAEVVPILDRMVDLGAQRICLMGGVSEFIAAHLPERLKVLLTSQQGDAMDGAVLLVQQRRGL